MIYSINYDLKKPGADYEGLYEAIKSLGASWWHYMDSCWLVDTSLDANGIWNKISTHLDQNDYCLVIGVTNDYQGWLPEKAWSWIRERKSKMAPQSTARTW